MSFTAEVKDELSRVRPKCGSCEMAMLSALIRVEGSLFISGPGVYRLEMATEGAAVARTVVRLLHEVVGLKTETTVRRSVLHKTQNYLITVPAQPRLPEALRELGILGEEGLVSGIDQRLVMNPCCSAAYLRGAFMAGGFIADPRGDFHFELNTQTRELADALVALLGRHRIEAKVTKRRGAYAAYLKGAEPILTFLTIVGAHKAVLDTEDIRVFKSMRNEVNRAVNAEMANQAKVMDAAFSQLAAIDLIERMIGLDSLPPALAEMAELRRSQPATSLRELGLKADPPLTKSAVYHRIRRLEEIAADLEKPQA